MRRQIAILGLGIFGTNMAKTLSKYDCDVIVIDKNKEYVQAIESMVNTAIIGDFTDIKLLEQIDIASCDTVVIASGTRLESTIIAIMHCQKLGVGNILVKANNEQTREVIEAIGITSVVAPEKEAGIRLAKRLLQTNIQEIVHLDDNSAIIEFCAPKTWYQKSLKELHLRQHYDINLIGYRTSKGAPLQVNLTPDYCIDGTVILVAIAESNVFEQHDFLSWLD